MSAEAAGCRDAASDEARRGSAAGIEQEAAQTTPKKERPKRPRIDLDDSIAQAKAAMKAAQKEVAEARRVARNERRKKQRLLKKAVTLSPDDLERIAVLKRCGLVMTGSRSAAGTPSSLASSDQSSTAASSTDPRPGAGLVAGAARSVASTELDNPDDHDSDNRS